MDLNIQQCLQSSAANPISKQDHDALLEQLLGLKKRQLPSVAYATAAALMGAEMEAQERKEILEAIANVPPNLQQNLNTVVQQRISSSIAIDWRSIVAGANASAVSNKDKTV